MTWSLSPILFPARTSRLGVIDVGSNSVKLALYEIDSQGQVTLLERMREPLRLAAAIDARNDIEESAVERLIQTLRRMRERAEPAAVRAIATQALRQARNGFDVASRAGRRSGVPLEIISGLEEARLMHLGVRNGLDLEDQAALVFDIGGGSAELVVGQDGEERTSASLKLGAVELMRRFLAEEPVSDAAIQALRDYAALRLAPVLRRASRSGFEVAVATSGTVKLVRTLAYTLQGQQVPATLHGTSLTVEDIGVVLSRLLELRTEKERRILPGMDPRRADTILAGTLVLELVTRLAGVTSWQISETALREGILVDTLTRERLWIRSNPADVRWQGVRALAQRFLVDENHALHVSRLSTSLFEKFKPLHELPQSWKQYLRAAAYLHEIGLALEHSSFHKHTHYLLTHTELPGHTLQERNLVAAIARFHRKRLPRDDEPELAGMSDFERKAVNRCAALLRLAAGLERGREAHVQDIHLIECRGGICALELVGNAQLPVMLQHPLTDCEAEHFRSGFGMEFRIVFA